jgi:molybdopterin/thiamine biosynthesis adenylyltransferase
MRRVVGRHGGDVRDAAFGEVLAREKGAAHAAGGPGAPRPDRAARFPALIGCDSGVDAALDRLGVAVIGAGAVGRCAAVALARLGIGWLWIVDSGRFKAESLLTQAIEPDDIPHKKASNAGRLCKRISPRTRVLVHDGPVEALDHAALADATVVLLATDNLAAEVEVGQRCVNLGTPLVHASVHGDTLVAQIRVYANAGGDGPCPECSFGEGDWSHLNSETSFSCEGSAPRGGVQRVDSAPTRSIASLCSLAADIAVIQILRHTLRLGAPVADTIVEYCGFTHRSVVSPLARNPRCPIDHVTWRRAAGPASLRDASLRALAEAAGLRDAASAAFTVGGLAFVESAACRRGHAQDVRRFARPASSAWPCARCGEPAVAGGFTSHTTVAASRLGESLDRPLRDFADPVPRWVLVHGDGAPVFLEESDLDESGGDRVE